MKKIKRTIAYISFDGGETPPGSHDTEFEILQLLMTTVTWLCERGRDCLRGMSCGWMQSTLPSYKQNNAFVHLRLKIRGGVLLMTGMTLASLVAKNEYTDAVPLKTGVSL